MQIYVFYFYQIINCTKQALKHLNANRKVTWLQSDVKPFPWYLAYSRVPRVVTRGDKVVPEVILTAIEWIIALIEIHLFDILKLL